MSHNRIYQNYIKTNDEYLNETVSAGLKDLTQVVQKLATHTEKLNATLTVMEEENMCCNSNLSEENNEIDKDTKSIKS